MTARPAQNGAADGQPLNPGSAEKPALTIRAAASADGTDWNAFVGKTARAELYHDYRWRTLMETVFGNECHYLFARDDGIRGVLPLVRLRSRLFGDFMVSVPYVNYGGIVADAPHIEQALLAAAQRLARELGVAHIELRHRSDSEFDLPIRDDKVTMRLALPASEEALWNSFKGKLRSQIRRPEKAGATTRSGGAELLRDFYSVFARNMRDLGTPVYPLRFFRAIVDTFSREAKLHIVMLEGRPVAAALTLAHRSTVEIPWASSLRSANSVGVNMLLYWSVLRDAVAGGLRWFDFGRSTKDSGTFRFKQQWGAEPQALRWHYWLPSGGELPRLTPSNPKYRLAIAVWKRLPLPVANALGPLLVKHLP